MKRDLPEGGGGGWIGTYILQDKATLVAVPTMRWAMWREEQWRKPDGGLVRVALHNAGRLFMVSTVFLGLDHGMGAFAGPPLSGYRPLVFETAVFPRSKFNDLGMYRWSSWFEAEAAHLFIVRHMIHNHRRLEQAYLSGERRRRNLAFARVLAGLPLRF